MGTRQYRNWGRVKNDEPMFDRQAARATIRIMARSYLNVEALLLGVSVLLLGGASLLLAHYGFTSRPEVVTTMVILLGIVVLLVAIGAFVALLRGLTSQIGVFVRSLLTQRYEALTVAQLGRTLVAGGRRSSRLARGRVGTAPTLIRLVIQLRS
jgi:hypothetical protein